MSLSRFQIYAFASVFLLGVVVMNAWKKSDQFYVVCVLIASDKINIMVIITTTVNDIKLLMNIVLVFFIALGQQLQRLFFGTLRVIEVEHLYERGWYALTETTLALTMFRDALDMRFAFNFGVLIFLKIFHWILSDRVDVIPQSPLPPLAFHVKLGSVFIWLLTSSSALLAVSIYSTLKYGTGVSIIFGFEHTILLISLLSTLTKYTLHIIDLRANEPWEDKSIYIFHLDLLIDFLKLLTYLTFFFTVISYYGLPIHIIRDLYVTTKSFYTKCVDLLRYRKVTKDMETRYATATREEIEHDKVCIICREDMVFVEEGVMGAAVDKATPKKLPCGHTFHLRCLKTWLERQQACPTCRRSVLDPPPGTPMKALTNLIAAIAEAAAAARARNAPINIPIPPPPPPHTPDMPADTQVFARSLYPAVPVTLTPISTTDYPYRDNLSDEELLALEGTTREAITARLNALHDIQDSLSGLITRLTQVYVLMPAHPE